MRDYLHLNFFLTLHGTVVGC